MPITLYANFKEALSANDFVTFNRQLEKDPFLARTMHFENNYALRTVVKKGILSSAKALLNIESVWFTFDEDEMLHLAKEFSHHKGIQRLIENATFARFEHYLVNSTGKYPVAMHLIGQSRFLSDNLGHVFKIAVKHGVYSVAAELLKNPAVSEHCGLNDLYLALKYSNHPGIVRALLKNPAIAKLVGHEKAAIDKALAEGNAASIVFQLQCLKGITDTSALAREQAEVEQASVLAKNSLFTPVAPPSSPRLTPVPEDETRLELF